MCNMSNSLFNFGRSGCGCNNGCRCGCNNGCSCGCNNGCGNSLWNWLFGNNTQWLCRDCNGNIRVNQRSCGCGCNNCCGCNNNGCGCNGNNGTDTASVFGNNGNNRFACVTFCRNWNGSSTAFTTSNGDGDSYYARQFGLFSRRNSSCCCGSDD